MLRGHSAAAQDVIEFAVPHTLAFTFFPAWVSSLREQFGPMKSRLIALNVHDAVMRLVEGSCDVLIAYHHASQPLQLDADRYEMVSLGEETLAPWVQARRGRRSRCSGCRAGPASRCLTWATRPGAYLGRVVDLLLKQSGTADPPRPRLRDRHGRRPEGDGAGRPRHRLPAAQRGARRRLRARKLVSAAPPEIAGLRGRRWRCAPTASGPARARRAKGTAQALWAVSPGRRR